MVVKVLSKLGLKINRVVVGWFLKKQIFRVNTSFVLFFSAMLDRSKVEKKEVGTTPTISLFPSAFALCQPIQLRRKEVVVDSTT